MKHSMWVIGRDASETLSFSGKIFKWMDEVRTTVFRSSALNCKVYFSSMETLPTEFMGNMSSELFNTCRRTWFLL